MPTNRTRIRRKSCTKTLFHTYYCVELGMVGSPCVSRRPIPTCTTRDVFSRTSPPSWSTTFSVSNWDFEQETSQRSWASFLVKHFKQEGLWFWRGIRPPERIHGSRHCPVRRTLVPNHNPFHRVSSSVTSNMLVMRYLDRVPDRVRDHRRFIYKQLT